VPRRLQFVARRLARRRGSRHHAAVNDPLPAPPLPAPPTPQSAVVAGPLPLAEPADVPRRVRWFSFLLFLRDPLAEEVPAFTAAVAALRRHAGWLLAGYAAFLALLVLPGLLRERSTTYHVTAVVAPHLLLWLAAMSVAYGWIGFRINLTNLRTYLPLLRHKQRLRIVLVVMGLWALVGGVTGFLAARWFIDDDAVLLAEVRLWFTDTFSGLVIVALATLTALAVPELVARLRLREHVMAERVRNAEAEREKLARQTAESELDRKSVV